MYFSPLSVVKLVNTHVHQKKKYDKHAVNGVPCRDIQQVMLGDSCLFASTKI